LGVALKPMSNFRFKVLSLFRRQTKIIKVLYTKLYRPIIKINSQLAQKYTKNGKRILVSSPKNLAEARPLTMHQRYGTNRSWASQEEEDGRGER
jgi:hypothetical protein